jgi:PII-like signaling protein
MQKKTEARLLRIFISSTDKFRHTPLYEVIVYAAKRYGLAGATVLKGIMGFGASRSVSSLKFFEITEKLPLVIEIVDEAGKIEKFTEIILPYFEKIRYGCMITVEKAEILLSKKGERKNGFKERRT